MFNPTIINLFGTILTLILTSFPPALNHQHEWLYRFHGNSQPRAVPLTSGIPPNDPPSTHNKPLLLLCAQKTTTSKSLLLAPRTNGGIKGTLLYLILSIIIILQASDTELNPDPQTEYPCQLCQSEVEWNQRAVAFDNFSGWFHVSCMGMTSASYAAMLPANVFWVCPNCGTTSQTSDLFDSISPPSTPSPNSSESLTDMSSPSLSSPASSIVAGAGFCD